MKKQSAHISCVYWKIFCALFLLFIFNFSLSNYSFATDVEVSGYGATGYNLSIQEYFNHDTQLTYYEGKIQCEMIYNDDIEAQIDFRGDSYDNNVELREFSLKLRLNDYMKLKVGNLKKPFGYEYLINREDLLTIDRSYHQQKISEMGYGGRSTSLMLYHKYDKDQENFPYTYYLSVFRNNGLYSGLIARALYYPDDDLGIGASYMLHARYGPDKIRTHGLGFEIEYEKKNFLLAYELAYVQNPEEIVRRIKYNEETGENIDERFFSGGTKIYAAYDFNFAYKFLRKIQPILVFGTFYPEFSEKDTYALQFLAGCNIHIHHNVILRLNADLMLMTNKETEGYSSDASQLLIQIMARF